MSHPITPQQSRAGRALLGWSQDDLAAAAGVGITTVRDFERERENHTTAPDTLAKVRRALEVAGVEIIDAGRASGRDGGPGVRLRR